jgi:Tol biopolymer transport system component
VGRRNIWRMNADGSGQTRLTNGYADSFPSFTPDGKWVVYSALDGVTPRVWKVALEGGAPVQLVDHPATTARVSPDGKLLAFAYPESQDSYAPPNKIAVVSLDGTGETKTFDFRPSGTVITVMQWASDSSAILYTVNTNNVSNIWRQQLSGGPPTQVTTFRDSLMTGFSYSADGKRLVCTRGKLMRDAVLISDMK